MKTLVLTLLCLALVSCTPTNMVATQATLTANKAQLDSLQQQVSASQHASQLAYDEAIKANDLVAARVSEIQLAAAKKDQAVLDKAKVVNTAGQTALDAASGNETAFTNGLSTLGGLLPPPFGTLLALAGTIGFGVWKGVQANKANKDAQSALVAQADVANHAATPGIIATDVATHTVGVVNGLSPGAAKLYNEAPTINIPLVPTSTPTIGV